MNPAAANAGKFWKQLGEAAVILNGGLVIFAGINLYKNNEKFYKEIAMPAFRIFSAETAHNLGIKLAKYKIVPRPQKADTPLLTTKVWGKSFPNPVGLAAGYDKHGEAVDGLLTMGFGFVEVGSVTPEPQPGNAKPRVFRLTGDEAVINRYGFNSDGHDAVYERLSQRKHSQNDKDSGLLGINLGKNKESPDAVNDYVKGVEKFGNIADYLVVNVSSPNTPGLRDMQKQEVLANLLDKVVEARNKLEKIPKPPLLVKIAPDLTEDDRRNIANIVTRPKSGVDGLIISNTTIARPDSIQSKHSSETGGLSGKPLREMSTDVIRDMYRLTNGQIPIVGVGGVSCGEDAYAKVRAGASLIQLYSALIFLGPPVLDKIKQELEDCLLKDGYSHLSEAVGADFKQQPVSSAKS